MSATTFVRRSAALVAVIAIGMGVAATSAQASSYGPYLTLASPSLNERSAPSTSAATVGSLPYHSTIYIACQTSGTNVGGSVVWDKLSNGAFISDYWTNTPGNLTWTPSIPRCGTTPPPPPPSGAAVGRTVSYNEGASGQCTWWAIDRFHAFSGYYPNFVATGNNGDARYWGGNAVFNGWTVTATPRVNSIVVFQPYTNGAGAVGHVAWVTAVSGSTITFTEMNYVAWNNVDTRTVTPVSSVRYILAP